MSSVKLKAGGSISVPKESSHLDGGFESCFDVLIRCVDDANLITLVERDREEDALGHCHSHAEDSIYELTSA